MKGFLLRNYNTTLILLIILLVGLAFYAGMLHGKGSRTGSIVFSCSDDTLAKLSVPFDQITKAKASTKLPFDDLAASVTKPDQNVIKGKYVGSINGTKYYAPSCGTVKRIKPENYIWFETKEDATLQGYTAGKC
jgi:hypothetical protein